MAKQFAVEYTVLMQKQGSLEGKSTLKSGVASLLHKADLLVSLPVAAFKEILLRTCSPGEVLRDREFMAHHEAAHALIMLLSNERIWRTKIGRLLSETYGQLEALLGKHAPLGGVVEFRDTATSQRFAAESPDRYITLTLAGIAATAEDYPVEFRNSGQEKMLRHPGEETWGDLAEPFDYFIQRSGELGDPVMRLQKINRVLQRAIDRVREFFARPECKHVMHALRTAMLTAGNQQGAHVHDALMDILEREHITTEELAALRAELDTITFDDLIESEMNVKL